MSYRLSLFYTYNGSLNIVRLMFQGVCGGTPNLKETKDLIHSPHEYGDEKFDD